MAEVDLTRLGFLSRIINFFKEIRIESRKVTWPDRRYVMVATVIILVIVVTMALFLMFLDFSLSRIIGFLDKLF